MDEAGHVRDEKPILHGRDHRADGADPILGLTADAAPLITDVYDNKGANAFGDNISLNSSWSIDWVRWQDTGNWSGYPSPIIGRDPALNSRWLYWPFQGSSSLIKVEYAFQMPEWLGESPGSYPNSDPKWWYCTPYRTNGSPGAWDDPDGNTLNMFTYGGATDFPCIGRGQYAKLEFYLQSAGQPYEAVAVQLKQTFPNGTTADLDDTIQGTCNITILKEDVFAV